MTQYLLQKIMKLRQKKELALDEKTNGREAVRLVISKQTGANAVEVCRDVRKELEAIQKQLPTDVKIETIYDSSENIQNSINSLEESVLYALFFVVLVVLFFLGKWRATLIIAITIPIAMIEQLIRAVPPGKVTTWRAMKDYLAKLYGDDAVTASLPSFRAVFGEAVME